MRAEHDIGRVIKLTPDFIWILGCWEGREPGLAHETWASSGIGLNISHLPSNEYLIVGQVGTGVVITGHLWVICFWSFIYRAVMHNSDWDVRKVAWLKILPLVGCTRQPQCGKGAENCIHQQKLPRHLPQVYSDKLHHYWDQGKAHFSWYMVSLDSNGAIGTAKTTYTTFSSLNTSAETWL